MVKSNRKKLQDGDYDILEHVLRFRMTVSEALLQLSLVDSKEKAKSTLRRLRTNGFLASAPLYGTRSYYHLTKLAANSLGQPNASAKPLAEQTKLDAFAMLSFCTTTTPVQQKLTLDEFKENFPELFRNGERPNYYIDTQGESTKLGYIRVDRGGYGRWDRLIARCRGDIQVRCDLPAFRELIDSDGFVFTIITALPQKRERIEDALEEESLPCDIRVVAIPEMLELVAPMPR